MSFDINRNRTPIRPNAIAYAKMIALLSRESVSPAQIMEETGLAHSTVRHYLRALYREKAIHVDDWDVDSMGRPLTPLYRLGTAKDAPQGLKPRQQTQADYRGKVKMRELIRMTAGALAPVAEAA